MDLAFNIISALSIIMSVFIFCKQHKKQQELDPEHTFYDDINDPIVHEEAKEHERNRRQERRNRNM